MLYNIVKLSYLYTKLIFGNPYTKGEAYGTGGFKLY